jgi:iron complex outermembrane receptor protein
VLLRCALASVALVPWATARGALPCAVASADRLALISARAWPAPLDRTVAFSARDISLGEALEKLATSSALRLSYSSDALPLGRKVCVERTASIGDVLDALLRGTNVEPVVVSRDQVVLTPGRLSATPRRASAKSANVLARVVVTGNPTVSRLDEVTSVTVIDRRQLERTDARSLAEVLAAAVPGMWLWEQSPVDLMARYGSTRGASSFAVTAPKVYIDGIEVANPLLVTEVDVQNVDRIEVIRGPQGTALYGADATSGVIRITTREHDRESHGVQVQSSAGRSASQFATGGVLAQDHSANLRAATDTRSVGLGVSIRTLGDYLPGARSREFLATGTAHLIGQVNRIALTARLFDVKASVGVNPLVPTWSPVYAGNGVRTDSTFTTPSDDSSYGVILQSLEPQAMRQYTLGGTATMPSRAWTQNVTFGIDGYALSGVPMLQSHPYRSAEDSALRAAHGRADRATLRWTSVRNAISTRAVAAKLTLSAEHSAIREETSASEILASGLVGASRTEYSTPRSVEWRSNSGFAAQTSVAIGDAFFVSGGVRAERVGGFMGSTHHAFLPTLGGSYVRSLGASTLKLRSAYGRSIRPVSLSLRESLQYGFDAFGDLSAIGPEVQSGVEAGLDLILGRTSLHVTRFDQRASGLIQTVARLSTVVSGHVPLSRVGYEVQNVGAIANRGWEAQGNYTAGALSLIGSISFVDSRVERVAGTYRGDLRAGDRMLEVPARTLGLTTSWTAERWSSSMTVSRASDWVNYDGLALARALAAGTHPSELTGTALRSYWREYDGVTRLRGAFTRELVRGLALTLTGENLLGQQQGEPDNVTIVPGRTLTLGLRAKF